jgi:opacity protein-like surface antigen
MTPKAVAAALCAAALWTPQASGFDWTGFYAGVGIGGLQGGYSDAIGGSIDYSGATIDGFAGFRIEALMLTIGAELDASYLLPIDDGSASTAMTGKAAARGTIGMELGPLLPFLSAGVAMAAQTHDPETIGRSDTVTHHGIVLGAGVDVALTDHAFARLEAIYSVFSEADYDIGLGPYEGRLEDQGEMRAALGWKF